MLLSLNLNTNKLSFQDPQTAIPKGTFLAIIITTISYLWFALTAGACVLRDANGNIELALNSTDLVRNCSFDPSGVCKYGLMNYYEVSYIRQFTTNIFIIISCFAFFILFSPEQISVLIFLI